MHVLFAFRQSDSTEWVDALTARLPGIKITQWDPAGPEVGADIALVWKPPAELFIREKSLKTIFNLGAGVDALLNLPALPAHIQVVRLEDAGMSDQIAEYASYALARIARDFGGYERAQREEQWRPLRGTIRKQWPVGVLGLGVVGRRVAQVLSGLGYPVAGWSRSAHELAGVTTLHGEAQLADFLKRTKVLINVLPLTAQTGGILNRANLSRLMPGAHLINVGRGEHLVEDDLIPLLDSGRLAGATLDVFQTEPLPAGHPFWRDPRIHVTPHIAGSTMLEESIEQIGHKMALMAQGKPVSGVVDRTLGY